MYVTLDDVKEVADELRESELRKELTGKLTHYKLDFSGRMYRDEIVKGLAKVSLDYLRVMAPRFNGFPPDFDDLKKTAQDLRNVPHSKKSSLSLDDRARRYLSCSFFKPQEIADFVAKKAEELRTERSAAITIVSYKNYQERMKIEDEVAERYQDGAYFLKALEAVCCREPRYEFLASGLAFARLFLHNRAEKTKELKKSLEQEMARYIVSPKSTQQQLKP